MSIYRLPKAKNRSNDAYDTFKKKYTISKYSLSNYLITYDVKPVVLNKYRCIELISNDFAYMVKGHHTVQIEFSSFFSSFVYTISKTF